MNHRSYAKLVRSVLFSVLVIAPLGIISPTLFAADQNTDEIVITVRKTEENAQDVPVQVSLYDEQLIQRERLYSIKDIAELTPSVQFDTGFWPSDTRLSIRGLFARAGRPSAAVLIDGIDAQSESLESAGGSALLNQRILDIERIEVARGPQSALYGRGAFSGAINYVTRRPEQEWNYSVSADAATDDRYELQATFGGPIIDDKLAFRAMISKYDFDGYYTNPNTGGGLAESDSGAVGLAFEWTPSDNFTAYWNTTYSDDENGPAAAVYVRANAFRVAQNDGMGNITLMPDAGFADCVSPGSGPDSSACLLVVTGNIDADESQLDVPPDPRFSTPTDYEGTDEETVRSNLILDWDINENISFRSASSYTWSDQSVSLNTSPITGRAMNFYPGTMDPISDLFANDLDAANVFHFEQFYQEFQLSGQTGDNLNWLVGLNGFWENASDRQMTRFWLRNPIQCMFPAVNGPNPDCTFEDGDIFNKRIERDTTSTSIFGLVGWNITDKLKLTVEGRVIRDVIEVWTDTADIAADALTPFPGFASDPLHPLHFEYQDKPGFEDKVSENNFVPRVTLDYRLSEDAMVYTSVAKGIKPPTYITNDFSDPALARVGSETLWTYEVGTKTQWDEGRVTLNGAFFYNDYKDQQQRVQFEGLTEGANPRAGVVNAANVNVYGVEVDASWAPTDNLFFSASYAYTNGEYDDFVLAEVQNKGGAVPGDADYISVSISGQAKSGTKNGDFSGNDTPGNPDHALSLLGKYQRSLTGDIDWYTQATATYQGKRWADIANLVELEDYWLATAQVGVEAERWTVAAYAENLFDDDTVQYAMEFIDFQQGFQLNTFSYPVAYWAYLPQPRTIGIKFQYRTP